MVLPIELQVAIEGLCSSMKLSELAELAQRMSDSYRRKEREEAIHSEALAKAYLTTRFPATFAAVTKALEQLSGRSLLTLLDVGAGPGTATFGAQELIPTLQQATLVERNRFMISVGKELAKQSSLSVKWLEADLKQTPAFEKHDLVIMSYALNELPEQDRASLIDSLWKATHSFLVLIEPGTPEGFARIRTARQQLIALGAHVVAPCPHQEKCPMANGDWCHFSARLQRSSAHRHAKGGMLNYEDEKFSYLIVSRNAETPSGPRILRHPLKFKGHLSLKLCTKEGLRDSTLSKRDKELYKKARKAEWGDSLYFQGEE